MIILKNQNKYLFNLFNSSHAPPLHISRDDNRMRRGWIIDVYPHPIHLSRQKKYAQGESGVG